MPTVLEYIKPGSDRSSSSVHYTDRDLYLITDNGIVFIFLDYKASLRADEGDTDAINRLVSHNIRVLDMRDDSRAMTNNLACHGDDAAFTLQVGADSGMLRGFESCYSNTRTADQVNTSPALSYRH